MKNYKSTINTEIIASDDGDRTYEVIKSIEGAQGACAFIISMYPTRSKDNILANDSTLNHMINHMKDLGLAEIHLINLFSKVVNSKMSVKGLKVDTENMEYINKLMGQKNFQSSKFIIAWGNSYQSSAAVTEAKREVLKMFLEHNNKGKPYQLTLIGKSLESDVAPHPLYLGIYGANCDWGIKEFKITKKILGEIEKPVKA